MQVISLIKKIPLSITDVFFNTLMFTMGMQVATDPVFLAELQRGGLTPDKLFYGASAAYWGMVIGLALGVLILTVLHKGFIAWVSSHIA